MSTPNRSPVIDLDATISRTVNAAAAAVAFVASIAAMVAAASLAAGPIAFVVAALVTRVAIRAVIIEKNERRARRARPGENTREHTVQPRIQQISRGSIYMLTDPSNGRVCVAYKSRFWFNHRLFDDWSMTQVPAFAGEKVVRTSMFHAPLEGVIGPGWEPFAARLTTVFNGLEGGPGPVFTEQGSGAASSAHIR